MDEPTLHRYATDAGRLADLYEQITPTRLYHLITTYFHPGRPTADIGCGSGRDAAWLAAQGFMAQGFDAVPQMLAEAASRHPNLPFALARLPELAEIPDEAFANLLCSGALMHIGREDLITAVLSLARVLGPGGRLLISLRGPRGEAEREADGRLFTAIAPGKLALLLETAGLRVLHREQQPDTTRPDVLWQVFVAEKDPAGLSRGLERIQQVLVQDKKDATYKFALMRALCSISRTEAHSVKWEEGRVLVPLLPIAIHWLRYYWPFVAAGSFVAQKRGERPEGLRPLAFRADLAQVIARYGPGGLPMALGLLDEDPEPFLPVLRRIAQTIRVGPVYYSGTTGPRLFQYECAARSRRLPAEQLGWVVVPEAVWLDISRFDHWIEDSLLIRWAQLTAEMNPGATVQEFLPLLLDEARDDRQTGEVRQLLMTQGEPVHCVWSGRPLARQYDVDHLIPFSVWRNNDWWNRLPSTSLLNNAKRDSLPTRSLLRERRESIIHYWRLYHRHLPVKFGRQVDRALGIRIGHTGWERTAFAGLQEIVERVAVTRGLSRWAPGAAPELPAEQAAAGRLPAESG